jgi:hypothetical protein
MFLRVSLFNRPDMVRNRLPESDIAEETARILFLTYGQDAVHMAVLRCTELTNASDKAGLASWKKVLKKRPETVSRKPETLWHDQINFRSGLNGDPSQATVTAELRRTSPVMTG